MATTAASLPNTALFPNSSSLGGKAPPFLGGHRKSLDFESNPVRRRRRLRGEAGPLVVASAAGSGGGGAERFYLNFTGFPFPSGPSSIGARLGPKTLPLCIRKVNLSFFRFYKAVRDCIWLFEQEQALGFSSVSTNIRMTVIKLKSGGLWVHAPIAPTKECIQLLKELDAPVEYIILPTFAYEHKIFSLKDEDDSTPWADEIEQKILSAPEVGIGPYVEVAFYHKPSRTLLVTDAVIFVPRKPPECISKESLLASAKNGLAVKLLSKGKEVPDEPVVDNTVNRQKGWERMVLQILFLGPSNLLEPTASFAQMSQKLIVSPIVKTLVFSKVPEKVRDWVDRIVRDWRFKRIIPAHFAAR
uniref:Uncharacterized protein n=1 Tax=Ananas comosus var. bracteatus TaxID=296719 RepID=A0A6V7PC71_ANACO|nr:unnamed protein product [Ananas comosus var. bracteatus]